MLKRLLSLFGPQQEQAEQQANFLKQRARGVTERLPLELRPYFLVGDEQRFYEQLELLLRPTPYRAFANVGVQELFRVTIESQRPAVYAKLQHLHLDFVLVNTILDYRPQLAVELDGRSHQRPDVQRRDRLKDDACASAGLHLIRLESRHYDLDEVRRVLVRELGMGPEEFGKPR